jgi:hypothetical protein
MPGYRMAKRARTRKFRARQVEVLLDAVSAPPVARHDHSRFARRRYRIDPRLVAPAALADSTTSVT